MNIMHKLEIWFKRTFVWKDELDITPHATDRPAPDFEMVNAYFQKKLAEAEALQPKLEGKEAETNQWLINLMKRKMRQNSERQLRSKGVEDPGYYL